MPEWAHHVFSQKFAIEYDGETVNRIFQNAREVLAWCDDAGINPPHTYSGQLWFDNEADAIAFKLVWMTE